MATIYHGINVEGVDWLCRISYEVTSWGVPRCYAHDEQPFRFEIISVEAAIDDGDTSSLLLPATKFIISCLEDDESLAEAIEVESHDWHIAKDADDREFNDALRNDAA